MDIGKNFCLSLFSDTGQPNKRFMNIENHVSGRSTSFIYSKKGLVDPTNGLLINTFYDVFKQHIPLAGIVRITM